MSTFIERMEHFVETFTQEDKSFDFFGLIKLNNLEVPEWDGGYDVVVSAKWLPEDEYEAIGIIITRIHETFNLDERNLYLGSVAILDKSEDFIKEILDASQNNIEVKDKVINGLSVREAIILEPKQKNEVIENNRLEKLMDNVLNELKVTREELLIYFTREELLIYLNKSEKLDNLMGLRNDNDSYSTINQNSSASNDDVFCPDSSQGDKENVRTKRRRTS